MPPPRIPLAPECVPRIPTAFPPLFPSLSKILTLGLAALSMALLEEFSPDWVGLKYPESRGGFGLGRKEGEAFRWEKT